MRPTQLVRADLVDFWRLLAETVFVWPATTTSTRTPAEDRPLARRWRACGVPGLARLGAKWNAAECRIYIEKWPRR